MTTKEIARNNDGEIIRITPKDYKGVDYIDVRIWYKTDGMNEHAPTKKGICFTLPQWAEFSKVVASWR